MSELKLVQASGGFSPRGKYHLVIDNRAAALCGAEPPALYWNVNANRDDFERLCPEQICKNCLRREQAA